MTYGEANEFVNTYLLGDNSNPAIKPQHYKMALMEIASLCEPEEMTAEYTGNETDVFRLLPIIDDEQRYIKTPTVPDPIDEDEDIPIDEQLNLAVIFFVCSYLSNKSKDRFEKKAEKIIKIYTSNVLGR